MSCKRGKTDGETKKSNRKCFFSAKCFWSEPKTIASFSGVSFVKKHEENKRRNTRNLVKNFKVLGFFSPFRPSFNFLNRNEDQIFLTFFLTFYRFIFFNCLFS